MADIPLSPMIAAGLVLKYGNVDERLEASMFVLDITENPDLLSPDGVEEAFWRFKQTLAKYGIFALIDKEVNYGKFPKS